MKISIVVASSNNDVIGKDNQLLWHLSDDLKRFKKITSGHCIVMGRKTFESIGKPLPNRTNIIITRNQQLTIEGVEICSSLEAAINLAKSLNETELFIIGGGEIFKESLALADKVYLTLVDTDIEGDTYFSIDQTEWQIEHQEFVPKDDKNEYDSKFMILSRL